jgi:N-formylglutamate amidohydrolase
VTLPLLLSVPHAGLRIPHEVADLCVLQEAETIADGDEGAGEIYFPLRDTVSGFVTTDIARAIVDQNRAPDDFRKDGVIKTHTCWDVPVYRESLPGDVAQRLIERYHRPYHARVRKLAKAGVILGVDGHTMAAVGPPVGPDTGKERPAVCLSDVMGDCPREWTESMLECFREAFAPHPVTLNEPFTGGYITRIHSAELPFVQVELSRAPYLGNPEKSRRVLGALRRWCERHL